MMKGLAKAAALAAGLAAAWALACCAPRAVDAVGLVRDLAAPQDIDAAVRARAVRYEIAGVARRADLYRPEGAQAALVLVPGAAPQGRRDPRLVAFAQALAARDFLVLVPALAGSDPVRVSAQDAAPIRDAAQWLARETGAQAVGLAGISYAAGPAILAALDLGGRAAFVFALGGYYDIEAALTYLTTGRYEKDGRWVEGPVDRRAKWRFLRANADRVSAEDRPVLEAIARRKLADPDADISASAATLGPSGRAAWRLIANDDPAAVARLMDGLPQRLRGEIEKLDLARRDLSALEAPLILVHGRDDPLVPYTQSLALAEAAGKADVYILDALYHVELGEAGLGDAVDMFSAAYRLLTARDRAPKPEEGPEAGPEDGPQDGPEG